MKAICPNDPAHKTFITSAHVMEDWLVDEAGNFISVHESLQTDHGPDPDNEWVCATCFATAKAERD